MIICFIYLSLFVGVLCLVFDLLCITLCPLYFCNHIDEVERAGCFDTIVFQIFVTVRVLLLFLMTQVVGLPCLIVVFPDHTHLPFVHYTLA